MAMISRRQFIGSAAAVAGVAWMPRMGWGQAAELPALLVQARAGAAGAQITTQTLRGGVSVLMGSGGNIAVLVGPEGKVVVDSGFSSSQTQVQAALDALSSDPLKLLIDTHWHFDHTDGNEWMHAAGATILAQENTRKRLSEPTTIASFQTTFPPAPAGALPTEVFGEKKIVARNGDSLVLTHYSPAHTDTDLSVVFSKADVIHLGDTWFNGVYPFIDYSTGGSINGMIKAADRSLGMASATSILIPGHGPVGTKAQLTDFRAMLVAVRDAVAGLKTTGKTLAETVSAKPSAAFDAQYGNGFMKPEAFIGLVYQGV